MHVCMVCYTHVPYHKNVCTHVQVWANVLCICTCVYTCVNVYMNVHAGLNVLVCTWTDIPSCSQLSPCPPGQGVPLEAIHPQQPGPGPRPGNGFGTVTETLCGVCSQAMMEPLSLAV